MNLINIKQFSLYIYSYSTSTDFCIIVSFLKVFIFIWWSSGFLLSASQWKWFVPHLLLWRELDWNHLSSTFKSFPPLKYYMYVWYKKKGVSKKRGLAFQARFGGFRSFNLKNFWKLAPPNIYCYIQHYKNFTSFEGNCLSSWCWHYLSNPSNLLLLSWVSLH